MKERSSGAEAGADRGNKVMGDEDSTFENQPVGGGPLASDPQYLPLSFDVLSQPANGSVEIDDGGSFTYTPTWGFVGEGSFPCNRFRRHYQRSPLTLADDPLLF